MLLFLLFFDPEVNLLINQLGNNSFVIRQQAFAKLEKMEERPIIQLIVASKSNDLHIKYLAHNLLNSYYNRFELKNYDKLPYMEKVCYVCYKKPALKQFIEKYLKVKATYNSEWWKKYTDKAYWILKERGVERGGTTGWPSYRLGTLYFAQDLLKKGAKKKDIIILLEEMVEIEKYYSKR